MRKAGGADMSSDSDFDFEDVLEESDTGKERISPRLDPMRRMGLSSFAKWAFLMALIMGMGCYVGISKNLNTTPQKVEVAYYLVEHFASILLATFLGILLPTVASSGRNQQDTDPASIARNAIIVGFIMGTLYYASILGLKAYAYPHLPPPNTSTSQSAVGGNPATNTNSTSSLTDPDSKKYESMYLVQTPQEWLRYRLPLALISAIIAFTCKELLAYRGSLKRENTFYLVFMNAVQIVILLSVLYPLMYAIRELMKFPATAFALGAISAVSLASSVGVLLWGLSADSKLRELQKKGDRRAGGIAGDGMQLTLTLVGGSSSGKTCFLAGAYQEWNTALPAQVAIESSTKDGIRDDIIELDKIADHIYIDREFPIGTVGVRKFGFQLLYEEEVFARFSILDYSGKAVSGGTDSDDVDTESERELKKRIEQTDGLILIADMSQIRRNKPYNDMTRVRKAYQDTLRKVAHRNGNSRVVPVALVLTKVDEYKDPDDDSIRYRDMEGGLKSFGYLDYESKWKAFCQPPKGPGIVRFRRFFSSAIWHSTPHKDESGNEDKSIGYEISKALLPTPNGCLAPLLWICANTMRWNVTLYDDLAGWLWGGSRKAKRRMEVILELERLASSMETKVRGVRNRHEEE